MIEWLSANRTECAGWCWAWPWLIAILACGLPVIQSKPGHFGRQRHHHHHLSRSGPEEVEKQVTCPFNGQWATYRNSKPFGRAPSSGCRYSVIVQGGYGGYWARNASRRQLDDLKLPKEASPGMPLHLVRR